MLSLLNMVWIFYLKYTHVDIIYHLCEAYILSIPKDDIFSVQNCAKCQVFFFYISSAAKCFIHLTQATLVRYSTHFFSKYFLATLCYIDLTQVYHSLYSARFSRLFPCNKMFYLLSIINVFAIFACNIVLNFS